jgi:PEGA domain
MRIAGSLLAFLSLSPALLVHRVGAQVVPQQIGGTPSQTGSATNRDQVNGSKQSGANKVEEESSSGLLHSPHLHLRLGLMSLGAVYSSLSGPACYRNGPPFSPLSCETGACWFPSFGSYPFFSPGYFAYGSDKGEVKLAAEPKGAEVYIDRAYAGTAHHLRSMWLDPGAYDLSLVASGGRGFHQRIYVLSGKSLKITARLVTSQPPRGEVEVKEKP